MKHSPSDRFIYPRLMRRHEKQIRIWTVIVAAAQYLPPKSRRELLGCPIFQRWACGKVARSMAFSYGRNDHWTVSLLGRIRKTVDRMVKGGGR